MQGKLNTRFILGSGSPRRKELLSLVIPEFEIVPSRYDESALERTGLTPEDVVQKLSFEKAHEVFDRMKGKENLCVIGGDTIVLSPDGELMGKPVSREDAFRMLRSLSGKTHSVLTAVTILFGKEDILQKEIFSVKTGVTFYSLSDDEIERYLDTGEPFDKAGSYGIQGKGGLLVRKIHGDYNNVVGLPISELNRTLIKMGLL